MINISGVSESRVAPVAANMLKEKSQCLIITAGPERARRLAADLSFFISDRQIMALPEEEQLFLKIRCQRPGQTHKEDEGCKGAGHRSPCDRHSALFCCRKKDDAGFCPAG